MSRSVSLFVILALIGLAIVAAHGHGDRDREHGDRHHKKDKHHDSVGSFYRRHVQCRQCINGADNDERVYKWCKAAGATSDSQGQCVPATTDCATGLTAISTAAQCPGDAPSSKPTCSLCTLDGYGWCQDESNRDDEYAGDCVALTLNAHAHSFADAVEDSDNSDDSDSDDSESESESGSGSGDLLPPRPSGEDNLSDFSDFRPDLPAEGGETTITPTPGSDDSDASNEGRRPRHWRHRRHHRDHRRRRDGGEGSERHDGSEGSEGSDASDAAGDVVIAPGNPTTGTASCPAGKRLVTSHAQCSSAAVMKASWKESRHRVKKHIRRGLFIAVPVVAFILVCIFRKRCKRRCAERCAERRARRAAAMAAVMPAVVAAPAAAAPAAAHPTVQALPIAYPVAVPIQQPLMYSHSMGSAPLYAPVSQEGAPAVEMQSPAAGAMYPGMAVGGSGYSRLGQDAV